MNRFYRDIDLTNSQNPKNVRKIQEGMSTYFKYLRRSAVAGYEKLYRGEFEPVHGQYSALSALFAGLKWTGGNDSITGAIDYAEEWAE